MTTSSGRLSSSSATLVRAPHRRPNLATHRRPCSKLSFDAVQVTIP